MHIIRYRVAAAHQTETVRDGVTHAGSIHHPEQSEFAGLVTRSHDDGSHDIVIFPPDKPLVHVHRVQPGEGPGTFSPVTPDAPDAPETDLKRGKH